MYFLALIFPHFLLSTLILMPSRSNNNTIQYIQQQISKCIISKRYPSDSHSSKMPADSGCLNRFGIQLGIFDKVCVSCILQTDRL